MTIAAARATRGIGPAVEAARIAAVGRQHANILRSGEPTLRAAQKVANAYAVAEKATAAARLIATKGPRHKAVLPPSVAHAREVSVHARELAPVTDIVNWSGIASGRLYGATDIPDSGNWRIAGPQTDSFARLVGLAKRLSRGHTAPQPIDGQHRYRGLASALVEKT